MKLNLGCGEDLREDYLNIDIRKLPGVDTVADITLFDFSSLREVDYIVMQHVLQYIPRGKFLTVLQSLFKCLQPGGHLEIRLPNLKKICSQCHLNGVSGELGFPEEMIIGLLYGAQTHQYDIVYNGFTSDYLQGILNTIGFEIISVVFEDLDMIITARKP